MQFTSTLSAEPNQDLGGIDPEEGCYFTCDPYRIVTLQALQGLDKKCSVVGISIGSVLAMYTLPFQQELLFHGGQPFSRAAPREQNLRGGT